MRRYGLILEDPAAELERATPDNFDPARYLLANPDIAAWALAGGDPREHLDLHGLAEARQQVSAEFKALIDARRRDKYARFAPFLDADRGQGGQFRFMEAIDQFPIAYGNGHFDLATYQRESAGGGLGQFDDDVAASPDKLFLEVGCGLRREVQDNCLYLEVYPSRSADLVMEPACIYPFADAAFDGIGCFAVLEHVPEPWVVAAELRRILKPSGIIYIDWPFLQPVHGYPSHYYNATRAGLEHMFADGFELLELGTRPNQTPDRTLLWLLRGWIDGLSDADVRAEMLGKTVAELLDEAKRSPFWKRVLAATPPDVRMTYACGNTLVARKL